MAHAEQRGQPPRLRELGGRIGLGVGGHQESRRRRARPWRRARGRSSPRRRRTPRSRGSSRAGASTSRSYLASSVVGSAIACPYPSIASGELRQRHHRPRAHVRDDLGGGQRAEPPARRQVEALAQPEEHPAGVEIARARGVDHRRARGARRSRATSSPAHDHRALLAAGERGDLAVPGAPLASAPSKSLDLVQRADLGLVGEEDVHVVLDQVEERLAVPLHAERDPTA